MSEQTPDRDAVVAAFAAELKAWRAARPGWTEKIQLRSFPPISLWTRAGGTLAGRQADQPLYARLMEVAGYLVRTGERME